MKTMPTTTESRFRIAALLLAFVAGAPVFAQRASGPEPKAPPAGPKKPAASKPAGGQKLPGGVADDQIAALGDTEVYVRRYADTVVVRRAADKSEQVLYSNTAATRLGVGDEVEQGSSGRSDWILPGGGVVSIRGMTHGVIEALGGKRDRLSFPYANQLTVMSQTRPLVVMLAGAVRTEFLGTTIKVTESAGRYTIRNEGDTPVLVTGDIVQSREATADISARPDPKIVPKDGPGSVTLGVGEEVRVMSRRLVARGSEQLLWGALTVRHDGDVELSGDEQALIVRTTTEQPGVVSVGGVTLTTTPNDALVVRRVRPRPAGLEAPSPTESAEGEDINTETRP